MAAFVLLTVAAASLTVDIDGVALAPVEVAGGLDASADEVTSQLLGRALALRDRAQAIDDLASDARPWPRIVVENPGLLVSLKRALSRALVREKPLVSVRIGGDDREIVVAVLEEPAGTTLRSRVPRGREAIEAVLDAAAYDLLLIASPLAAASLTAHDPVLQSRASALAEVTAAVARDPANADDPRALLVEGLHEAARGDCERAIERFARVIALHPSSPRAYVHAADCHARLGERDRARELLARVTQQSDHSPFALSLAGQAYHRLGQPEEALKLLANAHVRDPRLAGNAVAIGEVLLSLHRPEEAAEWLEAHPATDATRNRWLAALGLAQVRSGAGPQAQATSTALRAIDSTSAEATRIDAELAAAAKAWPQALGRFGALRLVSPGDGAARAGEGYALLGLRRFDDAVDTFQTCVEATPYRADCRLGLAIALREADRAEEALEALEHAARLDPLDPRIPDETARTLRALLRHDEASRHAAHAEMLSQRLTKRIPLLDAR